MRWTHLHSCVCDNRWPCEVPRVAAVLIHCFNKNYTKRYGISAPYPEVLRALNDYRLSKLCIYLNIKVYFFRPVKDVAQLHITPEE